jgi:hypothetical protein
MRHMPGGSRTGRSISCCSARKLRQPATPAEACQHAATHPLWRSWPVSSRADLAGRPAALAFAVALLASGIFSSSVTLSSSGGCFACLGRRHGERCPGMGGRQPRPGEPGPRRAVPPNPVAAPSAGGRLSCPPGLYRVGAARPPLRGAGRAARSGGRRPSALAGP